MLQSGSKRREETLIKHVFSVTALLVPDVYFYSA
jgi:hypothetical protein